MLHSCYSSLHFSPRNHSIGSVVLPNKKCQTAHSLPAKEPRRFLILCSCVKITKCVNMPVIIRCVPGSSNFGY